MFPFSNGKLAINLEKYTFTKEDSIKGTVKLTLKKPLMAKQLVVRLYGIATSVVMSGRSNAFRSPSIVFDFKQPLDGEKNYPAGKPFSYSFDIKIPEEFFSKGEAPEVTLGNVARAALFDLLGAHSKTRWYVQARLCRRGFDLTKTVQISIA